MDIYLITVPSIDTNYVSFTNTSMSLQHPPRPNIIFAVVARLPPPHPCSPQTHSHWLASQSHYPLPQRDSRPRSHMSRQPEIFNSIYIYNIYVDARLCVTISRQITYYISHRKPPTKGDIPEPDRRPRGAARNAASIVEASRSEGGQYAPMTKYRSPPVASSRLTTFGLHVRCPSTWWVVESLQKRATPPFCAFT